MSDSHATLWLLKLSAALKAQVLRMEPKPWMQSCVQVNEEEYPTLSLQGYLKQTRFWASDALRAIQACPWDTQTPLPSCSCWL